MTDPGEESTTVFIGGVGRSFMGDLDLGRIAIERLAAEDLGPHAVLEEVQYNAVLVAQHLAELRPYSVVLVGAVERQREPGTVERRRIRTLGAPLETVQDAVASAVTGDVTLDLLLQVGEGLGVLPAHTLAIEVEPTEMSLGDTLSTQAAGALETVLELVRAEVRRAPLLRLAEKVRPLVAVDRTPSAAVEAVRHLLSEIEVVDAEGSWPATLAQPERRRRLLDAAQTWGENEGDEASAWQALAGELERVSALEDGGGAAGGTHPQTLLT
ncbi:MAG TPA: hypothetical protein VF155_06110 [Candidatus Dormibacteraeota bacterium]